MQKIERLIELVESEFGACAAWQPEIAAAKVELRNLAGQLRWYEQQEVAVRKVVRRDVARQGTWT